MLPIAHRPSTDASQKSSTSDDSKPGSSSSSLEAKPEPSTPPPSDFERNRATINRLLTTSNRKSVAKKQTHSEDESTTEESRPTSVNSEQPSTPGHKIVLTAPEAEAKSNHQSTLLPSDDQQPTTSSGTSLSRSPVQVTLNPFNPDSHFDIDELIEVLEQLAQEELQSPQPSENGAMDEVDSRGFVSAGYQAIRGLLDYCKERKDLDNGKGMNCNPLMADSPISELPSPHTMNYLINRLQKNRNASSAGAGAKVLQKFIRFNIAETVSVSRRAASTTTRLLCLKKLMEVLENSEHSTVAEHAKVISEWKKIKLEAATWDGLKTGLKIEDKKVQARQIIYFHEHTPDIEKAAKELHFMANAELATLRQLPAGQKVEMPAVKLLEAVFVELTELTITPNLMATAGVQENLTERQQLVRNLAQEPAGWFAIFDKMKLK